MRIDSLTLFNINALQGRWHIDFNALAQNGIFAITGPTGAGKSTILDALCLALYGQTPRLGKITQGSNALMSRHTGECSAEVIISTGGKRYRIFWGQKRARGKPDGNLQSPRHEIADADSGEILDSKAKNTLQTVEALTGLNFERFVRAVLLAQGQFAAFLHAGGDERAPILEQITGTAIYSQLSIAVHARHSEAQQALQTLQGESTPPPDEAAIVALHQALDAAAAQVARSKAARDHSAAQLATWQQLRAQEVELARRQAAQRDADAAWQTLADTRAALERHRQSEHGAPHYRAWQHERAAHAALGDKIAHNHAQSEAARAQLQASEHAAAHAAAEVQQAQMRERDAEPVLRQARDLDSARRHLLERVQEQDARVRTLAFDTPEALSALAAQDVDKSALEARYHALLDGQTPEARQHALDQARERYSALRDLHKTQDAQKALAHDIGVARDTLAAQQAHHARTQRAETQAQQALDAAREKTADKRRIYEQALLIRNFEAHRAQLKDGEPCPLCGAREHPYAAGEPLPDDDRAALQHAEAAERQAERQWQQMHSAHVQAARDVAHGENALAQLHTRQRELAQTLAQGLQAWQVSDGNLAATLAACEAEGKRLADGLHALHSLQREREHAERILRAREWQHARQALLAAQHALDENRAARQNLLPDTDTETHAAALRAQVDAALAAQQNAEQALAQLSAVVTKLEAEKETLLALQDKHAQAAEQARLAFEAFLHDAAFADEAAWHAAQQYAPQIDAWQHALQQADAQREQAQTRLADSEHALARLRAALPDTMPDGDTLAAQYGADDVAYTQALHEQGQWLAREQEYRAREAQWHAQRDALAAQQRECALWREMYDLIGSADGKKFRNFAQGLTFDIMIEHANRELAKMSDRYLLVRAQHGHLELDVIDDYQGGETRTTKNLSGGEQFIVSLALALGLARMAGENIRIDSLFLDEGFGTLDEQSLDQALDTLASLPQQGKLIGIISHVGALRERIPTQIRVIPQAGGVSALSGTGIYKK